MSPAREQRRDDLWDYLVANPTGVTIDDIVAYLGCTMPQANEAVHDLRLFLGEYDDVNLPCDPQGKGERWVYRLVGDLDDMRPWVTNRIGDSESRVRTMSAMLGSIVKATDGRTTEGRRARVMERSLRRLVEDLDTLSMDGGTP